MRRWPGETVQRVYELHRDGATYAAITQETGVSISTARGWITGDRDPYGRQGGPCTPARLLVRMDSDTLCRVVERAVEARVTPSDWLLGLVNRELEAP